MKLQLVILTLLNLERIEGANAVNPIDARIEAENILNSLRREPVELYEYECEQGFRKASELYDLAGDVQFAKTAMLNSLAFSFAHGESIVPVKHFVPKYMFIDDSTYPDKQNLPDGFHDHLQHESVIEVNPILKARFLDLLWDLYRDSQAGIQAIQTYLEAAEVFEMSGIRSKAIDTARSLKRADELAKTLKKQRDHVWSKIVDYVHRYLSEHRWRDVLHVVQFTGISIPTSFIEAIRDSVLEAVQALQNDGDSFAVQVGLGFLDTVNLSGGNQRVDVMKRIASLIENRADKQNTALGALLFYDQALRIFMEVKDVVATDRILKKMQQYSKSELYQGLGVIPISEVSVSEAFVKSLESFVASLGIDEGLRLLSEVGIPNRIGLRQWVEEASKYAPLIASLQIRTFRVDGTINPADDTSPDANNGLLKLSYEAQIYQFLISQFTPVLRRVIAPNTISVETITRFVGDAFKLTENEILNIGLRLFFDQEFVGAAHVLVPTIETLVRELSKLRGINVMEPIRTQNSGVQFVTLETLLRRLRDTSGDDNERIEYLQFILLDAGLNVRNRVSHGLMAHDEFTFELCSLLIHTMFVVSVMAEKTSL